MSVFYWLLKAVILDICVGVIIGVIWFIVYQTMDKTAYNKMVTWIKAFWAAHKKTILNEKLVFVGLAALLIVSALIAENLQGLWAWLTKDTFTFRWIMVLVVGGFIYLLRKPEHWKKRPKWLKTVGIILIIVAGFFFVISQTSPDLYAFLTRGAKEAEGNVTFITILMVGAIAARIADRRLKLLPYAMAGLIGAGIYFSPVEVPEKLKTNLPSVSKWLPIPAVPERTVAHTGIFAVTSTETLLFVSTAENRKRHQWSYDERYYGPNAQPIPEMYITIDYWNGTRSGPSLHVPRATANQEQADIKAIGFRAATSTDVYIRMYEVGGIATR